MPDHQSKSGSSLVPDYVPLPVKEYAERAVQESQGPESPMAMVSIVGGIKINRMGVKVTPSDADCGLAMQLLELRTAENQVTNRDAIVNAVICANEVRAVEAESDSSWLINAPGKGNAKTRVAITPDPDIQYLRTFAFLQAFGVEPQCEPPDFSEEALATFREVYADRLKEDQDLDWATIKQTMRESDLGRVSQRSNALLQLRAEVIAASQSIHHKFKLSNWQTTALVGILLLLLLALALMFNANKP